MASKPTLRWHDGDSTGVQLGQACVGHPAEKLYSSLDSELPDECHEHLSFRFTDSPRDHTPRWFGALCNQPGKRLDHTSKYGGPL